ncbi:hypothetical protein Droror1_Dr00010513 [Drosera rotundifolia]
MSTVEDIEAAAEQLNGYELEGKQMRVNAGPPPPRNVDSYDGVTGFVMNLNKNPPQIVITGTIDPNDLIKLLKKINKRVLKYYQELEPEPEPILVPKPKLESEAEKREAKLESETKNKPEPKAESSNAKDPPPSGIYRGGSICGVLDLMAHVRYIKGTKRYQSTAIKGLVASEA